MQIQIISYIIVLEILKKKKKIDNLKLENKSFEVRINDSSSKEKWNEKSSCSNEHDRKITLKKGSCSSCQSRVWRIYSSMICEDLIGMSSNQKVKTMASARALLSSADRVNSLYHQLILLIVYTCFTRKSRKHDMHLVSRTKL